MTTDEYRAALARLDLTQGAFARLFTALGDQTEPLSIRRRVERWAQGGSQIPGEIGAFITLLERFPDVMESLRPDTASDKQLQAAAELRMPVPKRVEQAGSARLRAARAEARKATATATATARAAREAAAAAKVAAWVAARVAARVAAQAKPRRRAK